jgi:hypothetical protein
MSLGSLPQERVVIFFVSRLFCGQSRKPGSLRIDA